MLLFPPVDATHKNCLRSVPKVKAARARKSKRIVARTVPFNSLSPTQTEPKLSPTVESVGQSRVQRFMSALPAQCNGVMGRAGHVPCLSFDGPNTQGQQKANGGQPKPPTRPFIQRNCTHKERKGGKPTAGTDSLMSACPYQLASSRDCLNLS